ncbi:MAG: carbohydrate ABC transporter permease [Armatimonadota bacterium]|nr:carbohydrate ABC transporter permease [Armatimonadota bacterium]
MKTVRTVGRYLSVILVLAVVLLPMYWVVIGSFKTVPELTSPQPTFWPKTFTLEHYVRLFHQVPFVTYFLNSVYVAAGATAITLVLASLAAYSVYRCRYRGRELLFRAFISIYIFPRVLLIIPLYVTFTHLGIIDTLVALIIVNVTVVAPFSIWMLRAFFTGVPLELEDAAMVDGASRLQVLVRIFLPLSAPGLAALALNSFLMSWTEYLFAAIFIISDARKTLPIGMAYFLEQYFIDWGLLMASSVIIAVPPILLFGLAGRWFISGLTAGAIK